MSKALLYRRLYRSLLKVSKPFCSPSPNSAVLSCFLHRMGIDIGLDDDKTIYPKIDHAFHIDDDDSNDDDGERTSMTPLQHACIKVKLREHHGDTYAFWEACHEPRHILFRTLLREVVAGTPNGDRILQLPSQVNTNLLREVIAREFRVHDKASEFDLETRQTVAIMAWQVLNTRLAHAEPLMQLQYESALEGEQVRLRNEKQAALYVAPLPLDPAEYLTPGTFLVAHPLAPQLARKKVICILEHIEGSNESGDGIYGLVVNRLATSDGARGLEVSKVLRKLPIDLTESFGDSIVYEGGDVHMSWQMVYASAEPLDKVGGNVLPMVTDGDNSAALNTDRAIYYKGDMVNAAIAVMNGELSKSDVRFFAGATCWSVNDLRTEVDHGFWIPFRGPPEILLTETYESQKYNDDLWLTMVSAYGPQEAMLAHMIVNDEDWEKVNEPCDFF